MSTSEKVNHRQYLYAINKYGHNDSIDEIYLKSSDKGGELIDEQENNCNNECQVQFVPQVVNKD